MRALSTWIDGFIGSAKSTGKKILNVFGKEIPEMQEYFASDFGGHGWKIYKDTNEKYILEIDNIRVRESIIAHELVIDKIRAIAGSLGISQACGKVKSVTEDDTAYYLTMEGDEIHGYGGFEANDFIRCQTVRENGIYGYWVKIEEVNGNVLKILKSEFYHKGVHEEKDGAYEGVSEPVSTSMPTPSEGDEIVQYGNSTDTTRQSAIYIHANGQGQPAIDILEGIKTKSFANCLTCRLGGNLPDGGGFGLYSKNGKIISKTDDTTNYELNPDGTFDLGKGAIKYDGNQVTIGSSVKINWGASSQIGVEYATNTNATTPPTSGWSTDLTKVNPKQGQYLWTRTKYPNGTYSYSVSYMAKDGEDGIPGKDGIPMQPNLLDYTSFPQEIFDEKPSGLTLNGERVNGIDGYGAIEAEIDMGDDEHKDIWMFQEDVLGRVEKSTWYTLSFYAEGNSGNNLYTYIRSTDDKVLIDTTEKILVDGKEQEAKAGLAWVLSNTWVRHTLTFKTASELSEKNFLILFRIFGSDTVPSYSADICQIKLERGKDASAWCMSETDKIASVKIPSWLDDWSGETTSLGVDYVAAKNAFFGKKEDDKYTGIMMSSDGLTIGDKKVVGLYALNENGVMVAIDPVNQSYLFKGNIVAQSGQINGLTVGISLNGVCEVKTENFADMFPTMTEGTNKYAIPNFYVMNAVVIITEVPTNHPTTNEKIGGFKLPPFTKNTSDYNTALGFLGKTLHFINHANRSITFVGATMSISNFLGGEGVKPGTNYTLITKKSVSFTAHLWTDGSIYWVYEDSTPTESNTASSGGIFDTKYNFWINSKLTNDLGGGNNSEITN